MNPISLDELMKEIENMIYLRHIKNFPSISFTTSCWQNMYDFIFKLIENEYLSNDHTDASMLRLKFEFFPSGSVSFFLHVNDSPFAVATSFTGFDFNEICNCLNANTLVSIIHFDYTLRDIPPVKRNNIVYNFMF